MSPFPKHVSSLMLFFPHASCLVEPCLHSKDQTTFGSKGFSSCLRRGGRQRAPPINSQGRVPRSSPAVQTNPCTRGAHRALLTGRELLLVLLSNTPFLIRKPVCFQDKISTDIKNLSKMTSKDYKIYSQGISAKGVCAL